MNAYHSATLPTDDFSRMLNRLSQFSLRTKQLLNDQFPGLGRLVGSQIGYGGAHSHQGVAQTSTIEMIESLQRKTKFRVELLVNSQIAVKEVIATSEKAAVALAIHLLLKEYPVTALAKVALRSVEALVNGHKGKNDV